MFSYNFREMWNWYAKNMHREDLFEKPDNMAMHVIQTSEKYEKLTKQQIRKRKLTDGSQPTSNSNDGYLGAFQKRSITNIVTFKFIQNLDKYPHGLFCVWDKRAVYAVFPKMKKDRLFADHLSFMEGNIHITTYIPQPLCADFGVAWHLPKADLNDGVSMPALGYEYPILNVLNPYNRDALDIARAYKVHGSTITGGGPSRSIPLSKRAPKTDVSPRLEQVLLKEGIKSLKIMCIKCLNDDTWHVTCFAEENESFAFVAPDKDWDTITHKIIEKLDVYDDMT